MKKENKIVLIVSIVILVVLAVALCIHFFWNSGSKTSISSTPGEYDNNLKITDDGLYFTMDEDNGTAVLYAYKNKTNRAQEIVVPDTVDDLKVVEIGANTFADENVKAITIGKNVTKIGPHAFQWCPLTDVVIPNTVTSIGKGAFLECESLKTVTIPKEVATLDEGIFEGCSKDLIVIVEKDSKAAEYARANGITIQYK